MAYEYLVVEVKDSLIRGKQSSEELQKLLNHYASYGYRFVHMMTEDLKGRMGVGSTSGVMITFEREYPGKAPNQP